jgi:hypothetical protein
MALSRREVGTLMHGSGLQARDLQKPVYEPVDRELSFPTVRLSRQNRVLLSVSAFILIHIAIPLAHSCSS